MLSAIDIFPEVRAGSSSCRGGASATSGSGTAWNSRIPGFAAVIVIPGNMRAYRTRSPALRCHDNEVRGEA